MYGELIWVNKALKIVILIKGIYFEQIVKSFASSLMTNSKIIKSPIKGVPYFLLKSKIKRDK